MFLSRYFIRVFGEENDSEDSAKISNQKKKKKEIRTQQCQCNCIRYKTSKQVERVLFESA